MLRNKAWNTFKRNSKRGFPRVFKKICQIYLCLKSYWKKEKEKGILEKDLKNAHLEGFWGFRKKLLLKTFFFFLRDGHQNHFYLFRKEIFRGFFTQALCSMVI